ncbi:MAG: RagB/SusD family nutrient uptake outer membrane protein [Dysgonamonadaceae bacterium]|jgi:hypothetical protein|nr:RagB/SusD family nutrient uptake outer membrane protein [Dysgonamonadaceae bacterium]
MKKTITLFTLCFFMVFFSCSLEEHPARITAEGLAQDKQGAEQLVTGIYNRFWSSYLMTKTYWEWVEYDHDLSIGWDWALNGAGMGNFANHWGYNNDSDPFRNFYIIISRCNSAKAALETSDLSDVNIAHRYGEVLFLRAWSYFHLVRMYGPVPIRLSVASDNDSPRAPIAEVYEQIVSDLKDAINNMQYGGHAAVGGFGHADRTAAELLLARVYCTMASGKLAGDGTEMYVNILNQSGTETQVDPIATATLVWTRFTTQKVMGSRIEDGYASFNATELYGLAASLCSDVIARKGESFDLLPEWYQIWGDANKRNKEFVWGIASSDDNQFLSEGAPYYTIPPTWGGGGVILLSDGCYKMYNYNSANPVNDERVVSGVFHYVKDATFDLGRQWYRFPTGDMRYNTAPDGIRPASSDADVKDMYEDGTYYRPSAFSTKWYGGSLTNPNVVYARMNSKVNQDMILIRYSEAYLLRAEARNELDDAGGALADLQVIRNRVHAAPVTTTDKVQLRSMIFQENGLEYALEYKRRFDLLRWGMYMNVMNATVVQLTPHNNVISRVREERSLLCPVPTSEITQNKLFGSNNPGW